MSDFLFPHCFYPDRLRPAFAQPTPQPAAPKTVYIRAGHLFDGTGDKVRDNMVIVVVGDRIQSVCARRRGFHSGRRDRG